MKVALKRQPPQENVHPTISLGDGQTRDEQTQKMVKYTDWLLTSGRFSTPNACSTRMSQELASANIKKCIWNVPIVHEGHELEADCVILLKYKYTLLEEAAHWDQMVKIANTQVKALTLLPIASCRRNQYVGGRIHQSWWTISKEETQSQGATKSWSKRTECLQPRTFGSQTNSEKDKGICATTKTKFDV